MHCFHSSSLWRAVLFLLPLLLLGLSSYTAHASEVEITNDGSILQQSFDPSAEIPVYFDNKSKYRIDIYWDDGKLGKKVSTVNAGEEGRMIKTYLKHKFFITQHGVREGLHDPDTDTQYRFTVSAPQQVFVIPESAAPPKETVVCRDRYPVCADKASRGHCKTAPGWMIVNCCESCDPIIHSSRLMDHKVRCTRDFLNVTNVPAWRPGDLNKLFASWATDEKYTRYEPQVVSSPDSSAYGGMSGPWVIVFDNFLSDVEVDALIEGGRLEGFERSKDIGVMNKVGESSSVLSQGRTSSTAWCRSKCEALEGVKSVSEKVEELTGIPRTNYEKIQVLEYDEGQFYQRHHDASEREDIPSGQRIMTWFFYLSNVEEGGETYFNNLDIAVKPKKGRALVWPSVTDEDPEFWDTRMYHEAKAVIKGKKFAANYWIHLYDFQTALLWGCTGGFK